MSPNFLLGVLGVTSVVNEKSDQQSWHGNTEMMNFVTILEIFFAVGSCTSKILSILDIA